ncbi:hypothetical protein BU26DRAFT_517719 [Trematosphaeria pertusa]|uniref:Uncharacterized protein n=1 Tax=Trematosphaeria pertusa TaxID=390896 RepID=A0A6A6INA5_9PLEO|nr:uncharacterized protein BU26DRAFT_517719 [Trematosphaeria pertusa]KAF2250963.1 hypothetical protein BU26DRAFT_517719 [Trematosphaeria pertusa]
MSTQDKVTYLRKENARLTCEVSRWHKKSTKVRNQMRKLLGIRSSADASADEKLREENKILSQQLSESMREIQELSKRIDKNCKD